MIEFQALRRVHGHQLHGVAGFLFQIDRSAGLLEIVQILHKFLQALRLALRLPLAHELREPVEIFAVFGGDSGADFEGLGQFVE